MFGSLTAELAYWVVCSNLFINSQCLSCHYKSEMHKKKVLNFEKTRSSNTFLVYILTFEVSIYLKISLSSVISAASCSLFEALSWVLFVVVLNKHCIVKNLAVSLLHLN